VLWYYIKVAEVIRYAEIQSIPRYFPSQLVKAPTAMGLLLCLTFLTAYKMKRAVVALFLTKTKDDYFPLLDPSCLEATRRGVC